ncbi:MAG: MOSC domain-containing protein [Alphaproteobacteria bacterium]
MKNSSVAAVWASTDHGIGKQPRPSIRIIAGMGVEDDIHAGAAVQHRSRVAKDPSAPNLRQVHLLHSELHGELAKMGFQVAPGQMGENLTTRGLDLLALPRGTVLHLGPDAAVEVTGLRNPCHQLNKVAPGLMQACLDHTPDGGLVRKAGIMGIALISGMVRAGDNIRVELPAEPYQPLEAV